MMDAPVSGLPAMAGGAVWRASHFHLYLTTVVCMPVQDAGTDSSCKCLLQSEKQLMKCVATELEHLLSLRSRAQQLRASDRST